MVKYQKHSKIYNELTDLWNQGNSRKFLMEKYNLSSSVLHGILKKLNLPNKPTKSVNLTSYQNSVLIGTILGDTYISKGSSKASYINFAHTQIHKEYFYKKIEILKDLDFSYIKEKSVFDKRTKKFYHLCTCISKACKELKILRNIFYKNGKKCLPIEYLEKNFDKTSLAFLYMDDGNTQKYNTIISTQCFERAELELFVKLLKKKFDLHFTVQLNNTLRLKQKDVNKFRELIKNDVNEIECMKYKIMSS